MISTGIHLAALVLATGEDAGVVSSGSGLGVGALALMAVVVLLLGWMAYLYINSRRSAAAAQDPAPPNLSPPASDDELENRKLTRVLRAALFGSALLAIALPWYAINEPDRQDTAAESILEEDVEAGAHWFSVDGFACAQCHGPTAGGGAAPFTEARSGVDVSWAVPSLDDVLFRYSEEEVKFWIVFGRDGTPMPANGLEGGGAMTVQEVDQTIEYLKSIQLSQVDAFAKSESTVDLALKAIEGGEARARSLINLQQADIDAVNAAPDKLAVTGSFADDVKDLLQAPGTCTAASAKLVDTTCEDPGEDSDRDGLTDDAEKALTEIASVSMETLVVPVASQNDEGITEYSFEANEQYALRYDPFVAFTNIDPDSRNPAPDLDMAAVLLEHLETDLLLVGVTADRQDQFLEGLNSGMAFLEQSLADQLWNIDYATVATNMDVSEADAQRGVGLFNSYCARCHTGGYSAGAPFEQGAGTGAWGPSLLDGRAEGQFPTIDDQVAFVMTGSDNGERYGVNGLGTGRMPGFGQVLSVSDIELIVKYERTL
ncbi:MAG: cytochrome c [Actinomycetia bacterium]|nr:cytochrome c [Actinomycetes bacterium]